MEKCCVGQIVENSVNTAIFLSLPFLLSRRGIPRPTLHYEGWKRAGKGTQRDKGLVCTLVPSSSPSQVRLPSKWEKRELCSETAAVCAQDSPRLSAGRKDIPPFEEREPPLPKETRLSRLGAAAPPVHTIAERYLGKYETRAAPVPSGSRGNGRESGQPISWLASEDQERCDVRCGDTRSGRHRRPLRVTLNRN